ncbi:unnamed protein product [Vitrella brassicaformis CCMP3155]|uniref:Selenide, water dikinase n=2 Tax=Vitrella brassicaformis TaxID=1169539 RepID=A0A0G4FLY8_VITBC|nr:unnamed protein product [Vitrella brassicaformis CCMP3155]|eukprot:CEM15043.1 unnamed protein product [Vitrella brassicaformis CCMP3155]
MAMKPPDPIVKDLVLVGGGHAHVQVLKSFGMDPIPGVRVTLISRDVDTPYSGMLPGHIAGHYTADECHIDLQRLCRFAKAALIHTEACGLDTANRRVVCKDGRPPVAYDVLSIDIGSTPSLKFPDAPRLAAVKPIDRLSHKWGLIKERIMHHTQDDKAAPLRVLVVGGGAAGVEMALAMQHRLKGMGAGGSERLKFTILTKGPAILQGHAGGVQRAMQRVLRDRHVEVACGCDVVDVKGRDDHKGGTLACADGRTFEYDECIWCTHASAQQWLTAAGLDLDAEGFIRVDATLQSTNTPNVFAAGDIASVVPHPRPKAGVFAVRQGPPLTANLRRALLGQPLVPFTPQKEFLSLISTGDKYAVASRGAFCFEGGYWWTLKDYIDRAFMQKFTDLPSMADDAISPPPSHPKRTFNPHSASVAFALPPHPTMRCAGCGGKIGASILTRVLKRLQGQVPRRDEVVVGMDDPDDAAVLTIPADDPTAKAPSTSIVQTIDFFRAFMDDPYVFGQICATHALSDCYAMGAKPLSALAMVSLPFAADNKLEEQLFQLMSGACKSLSSANCALVGGHTAESDGPSPCLGFTITGTLNTAAEGDGDGEGRLLSKGGMRGGDKVMLTKAIGTGCLFAADMKGKARGRWMRGAVASMLQSNGPAADVLRKYHATACTDITGFGLLGHLSEMVRSSQARDPSCGIRVRLDPSQVPLLDGALECVKDGHLSTLQESNERVSRFIIDAGGAASSTPSCRLLFDPQTSGGLIATVPASAAAACIEDLRASGHGCASVIGDVETTAEAMAEDEPFISLAG